MRLQKIIIGLSFIIIIGGGVFSFFYFSFGEVMMGEITKVLQSFPFFQEREGSDDEKDGVWSPGPLVKDDDNGEGFLTRAGIIEETNRQRENFEKNLLGENQKLNEIAEIKMNDMFEKQYFAHISPDGVGVGDIAKNLAYEYLLIGDNLALGSYRDDEDVVQAWMNSPGHRKNILEEKYEEIGVAARKDFYNGREVWMAVQVFAMPPTACPQVNPRLATEIDRKKAEAEAMLVERSALQKEIDNIKPRGGEEHIQKVEEYNKLVEDYNNLVFSLDSLIDEYNRQIKLKDECIRQ